MNAQGKTVRELAEELHKSRQAVYNSLKRISQADSQLYSNFTVNVDGQLCITPAGEEYLKTQFSKGKTERRAEADNVVQSTQDSQRDSQVDNLYSQVDTRLTEDVIGMLREQLEAKDRQISELHERLKEAQISLQQAQQLQAATMQQLLQLQAPAEEVPYTEDPAAADQSTIQEDTEATPEKKSLWKRIAELFS